MKPSETTRGTAWLQQFEPDDEATAALLLDAVRFVPGGDVIAGLRRAIERFLSDSPERTPVAAVPVLSHEDMISLGEEDLPALPTAFRDFDPSQALSGAPGSEALVAQLIHEIKRSTDFAPKLVGFPVSLDLMKVTRSRTLICVTDYIGSGRQALRYIDAWHRHPTIRSWRSYGYLKIAIFAFAATTAGLRAVRASPHVDIVEVTEAVPALGGKSGILSDPKFAELCRIYANRGGLGGSGLGFARSGGLFANSFSVPNNLPSILVRRSPRWTPFFAGRSSPSELADQIDDFRPRPDIAFELAERGQTRLAARFAEDHVDERWQKHIAMLALLPRSDEEIATAVGVDLPEVMAMRASLVGLMLVDEEGRVTRRGRLALLSARAKPRLVTASLRPNPSPYYPRLTR